MRAYFVILAFIILVSGCVNPFGGSLGGGGPGVVINSFSFAPSNLKSNQLTKLSLSIENRGDYAIENDDGMVYLFNLPDDWEISDKSDSATKTERFSLMAPQTQDTKKYSGGSTGFEWVLRAPPNLPKDEIFSYIAQARVCYPYKTKIWGRLEVVSENAWLQKPPAEHAIAVQQTQGPLKVEFISKQPLMVETDVRIKVRITNVGDGVVTANECDVFETAGDDESDTINNLNKITLGDSDCTLVDELYLKKGQNKETYLICTPPSAGNNPISTSDFTMELTYNYYSDKKASVSVTGTSEDATGGMVGGGGTTGVITLTDVCTKLCAANNPLPPTGTALGMCATEDSSIITYPGTNVDVVIEPLITNTIPSLGTGIATIKTLNLHDAKVSDLGLEALKLSTLQTTSLSVQYEKSKIKTRPDIGIVKYLCDTLSNGMRITSTYTKGSDCTTVLPDISLSDLDSINGISGYNFKDLSVAGLQITSILGRTLSEITGGNITAINIEDFKLSELSFTDMDFLKYAKCNSKNVISPYADDVYCQCVTQVSKGYAKFDGTTSAECTAACTTVVKGVKRADGGVCDATTSMSECSGTKVYDFNGVMTITPNTCSPNPCMCYDIRTISSTESALLCSK